ncbi:MAG: thermonuclease family protein [Ignavibacteria bacterium]|jgi:micrococcal nuclease|nr:thermonuclease family protein [Ignavibacteria bacterium]MDH7528306.1 thermonuclease family protein [Ignavibacteria bacterium]
MIPNKLYHYRAVVVGVYDGDTINVNIDLGLSTWINNEKLRLARINAPEIKGKERAKGLKSRDFLRDLLINKKVIIQTIKDRKEKYGRYLAEIWLEENGKFTNVNDLMVQKKLAVYKKY